MCFHIPFLSVIIPVYNLEKYLQKSLDSIISQSFQEWEVILVDDGSKDTTPAICDGYVAKDSRIRVIHKENGGVSSARNMGVEKAKGEWITFLDADDWLLSDTLESLLRYTEEYDVIRFSMQSYFSKDHIEVFHLSDDDKDTFIRRIIKRDTILGCCAALYRKDLFSGVRFNEDIVNGEDWIVLYQLCNKANKIKIVDEPFYVYNHEVDYSCTSNPTYEKLLNVTIATQLFLDGIVSPSLYSNEIIICKQNIIVSLSKEVIKTSPEYKTVNRSRKEYLNRIGTLSAAQLIDAEMSIREIAACMMCQSNCLYPVFWLLQRRLLHVKFDK